MSLTSVSILTSHVRFFVLLVMFELSAIDLVGNPSPSMALVTSVKRILGVTSAYPNGGRYL